MEMITKDTGLYDLMDKFEDSSLTLLEVDSADLKIRMERAVPEQNIIQTVQAAPAYAAAEAPQVSGAAPSPAPQTESAEPEFAGNAGSDFVPVKAPLVGVFYAAPSPTDKPYVEVGQTVREGQVLCLVEAMKMMNELTSPVDGVIRAIHGVNEELVEFDQVLFEVEAC